MEGSQVAIVTRIEDVLETAHKEMEGLQRDLVDINKKLLPARPVPEEAKLPKEASPSGWFEQISRRLISLRTRIQVTRLEEAQRLKRAVAAGEVVRTDMRSGPSL